MNSNDMSIIDALVLLHAGTQRQGPGDDDFSLALLSQLPGLPTPCNIADLGCGTGSASLLLAKYFQQSVLCVDNSATFLDKLEERATQLRLGHLIKPFCADMGALDPAHCGFDLLWSEGAAYNLTFAGAMAAWRPLMKKRGVAVVSEMSWFGAERPQPALDFWSQAYPAMADEPTNIKAAEQQGFEYLFSQRLPSQAWWDNYYNPLLKQLEHHANSSSPTLQQVIRETQQEIDLFRRFSEYFGYTFYVLRAA